MNNGYAQELLSEPGNYLPTEDYGAIGNLRTVALVGRWSPDRCGGVTI